MTGRRGLSPALHGQNGMSSSASAAALRPLRVALLALTRGQRCRRLTPTARPSSPPLSPCCRGSRSPRRQRTCRRRSCLGVLVVVVAQAPDDVDVAAGAQVLGRVVGQLAPEGPLDRGRLLVPCVTGARRTLEMTVTVPLVSGPSLPLTLSMRTAEARRPFLCSTLTNAMTCSFEVKAAGFAPCIALIHLLLGPSRSRPRAGGGWARPLPSREGVGDGWSCSRSSRSGGASCPAHRVF
jgi:hypothetical protein